MNLHTCILTENDCYKRSAKIVPKGVMVHSTGANNPNLKRYVQPDDGRLGLNGNGNDWNRSGVGACVHAFIGKLKDGTIAAYQTLPWNHRGWHCGSSGNDTHISFEICEDALSDADYFEQVYVEAAELTAYLCKTYGLDPLKDGVVIDHAEGCKRGIASNHGDVGHWFPKHGKGMDTFRADVRRVMNGEELIVMTMTKTELTALIDERAKAAAAALIDTKLKTKLEGEGTQISAWAQEELAAAIASGITDGTRPLGYATRQEAAIMVQRAVSKQA